MCDRELALVHDLISTFKVGGSLKSGKGVILSNTISDCIKKDVVKLFILLASEISIFLIFSILFLPFFSSDYIKE